MTGLAEHFASCLVEKKEQKEGFANPAVKQTEALVAIVLHIAFQIAVILLVAFLGATLWNETLVPAMTCVKKVSTLQILGIYFLARFFLI